jgi:ferredoxin
MSFTISVDADSCMGAQRCMFLAPSTFDLNEDGIAEVLDAATLTEEQAQKIAAECPNFAIAVQHRGD